MSRNTLNDTDLAEAISTLKEDMRRFKDDVKTLMEDAKLASKETLASAARHLKDGTQKGAHELHERFEQARDFGAEKFKSADEQVKAHPYWTALIAAGVGALIGRFFRR